LECKLRVLDTEITTEERIDAWKKGGGAEAEYEMLRFKGITTYHQIIGINNLFNHVSNDRRFEEQHKRKTYHSIGAQLGQIQED